MKSHRTNKVHSSTRGMRKTGKSRLRFTVFTLLPLTFAVSQALANPDGGVVVGGQAAITQRPGVTIVDQASNRTIINWNGFNIDPGELTQFNQPGMDAVALNRVIGNDPSQLLGALKANGHVWLVNPNGILFGPSARVDVHGLLATTSDITNQDFLAGRNHFTIPSPNAGAAVVNQGSISIGEHGLAALVAPHVRNAGIIQGKMGQVVIAGTPTFTLDFYGDGLIQFEATSKVTENTNSAEPLVRNDGTISVDGGNVLITANAAAGLVDETINMDGIIEARSVGMVNGAIVLMGGDEGLVRVAGSLDASGSNAGETGGTVKVLGEKVALYSGTNIDVSGDAGGGEVLVGGNFQGKGAEPNAKRTYVASGASIDADAVTQGDGGKVIVWADEVTGFAGDISADGGSRGGDGGFVEVSGKQSLAFAGNVSLDAAEGNTGTLLLDPSTLTIIDVDGGEGGSGTLDLDLSIDGQILAADPDIVPNTVSWGAIDALGASANVILEATGDVTIDDITGGFSGIPNSNIVTIGLTDGSLQITSTNGSIIFADLNDSVGTQGGNITLDAAIDINAGSFFTRSLTSGLNSGNINLTAGNDISVARVDASDGPGNTGAGNVTLNATNGNISFDTIYAYFSAISGSGDGGQITMTAGGEITSSPSSVVDSSSFGGNGGNISVTAGGKISLFELYANGSLDGGDIQINSNGSGDIVTGILDTSASTGSGGNISLTSINGSIDTNTIIDGGEGSGIGGIIDARSLATGGIGGSITLTAPGSIIPADQVLTTNNSITFDGPVSLDANNIFAADTVRVQTFDGDINFNGTVNGNNGTEIRDRSLIIDGGKGSTISSITFGSTVGETVALTNLAAVEVSSIELNGSVTTSGSQRYEGSIDLKSDVVLTGQELDFTGTVGGTGSLGLQPSDPAQAILVGGTDTGNASILELTGAEINLLAPTIASITIGRANGTGTLTVDPAGTGFSSPLTLQSPDPGGAIIINGPMQVDANLLNLAAGDSIDINANITTTGGSIDINSNGTVDTTGGDLDPNGGDVRIAALNDVFLGNIFTGFVQTSAGDILITSTVGAIDTSTGELNAATDAGNAGAVRLEAATSITTGEVFASSLSGDGGDITLISNAGAIDTSLGELNSISVVGNAGAVRAEASSHITTGNIFASAINNNDTLSGTGSSGGITLTSLNGDISTGGLLSPSEAAFGPAGSSGDIVVTAPNGSITVDGLVWAFSNAAVSGGSGNAGNGGAITLSAAGDITVLGVVSGSQFSIQSKSRSDAGIAGDGSPVTITSNAGSISVNGDINSSSIGSVSSGNAGSVALNAPGSITIDNIDASAGDLATTAASGSGGAVTLTTSADITAGDISSASSGGSGGAIDLDSGSNITAGSITLGSIAGLTSDPFTADAPTTITIAGLAPNAADINIGTQTRPGNLLLPNVIDTDGGNVTLLVGNAYTFATDLTTDLGNLSLDGLQAITLAAPIQTDGGNVTVQTGSGALTVDGPVSAGDPLLGSATIELAADSDLILNNDVTAQSIALRAGNAITQSVGSSISATNLGMAAVAAPTLNVGTGDVVTLAAQISGAGNPFSFTDNNGLIVGQVGSLAGISTNNGDVTLDVAGDLTVDETINTGSTIVLQATENISINAPFNLATQAAGERVVLQAGDDITVNAAITTQGADLHIEANSPHQGFGANGSVGGITSNAPLATNGGDITLIGTGAIDMRAIFDAGDGTISHNPPGPFTIVVADNANFLTNARTTGAIVLGRVQSAGDDGLGTASETYTASDITFNSMNLDPAVASEINVIATNNVTFAGNFTTSQALFVNADANADDSGAISTVNGIITPGGPLQLSAGSGIDIDTTNLGPVAAFTSGGNIVIENTGGSSTVTTVGNVSGLTASDGTIKFITDGGLTVEQPIQATASSIDQTSILLAVKGGFVNVFTDVLGQTALQPGGGRYLMYSVDPGQDTRGMPVDQFSKRYSFPFDPNDPDGNQLGLASDDNFFLYEISPTLTIVADDASRGIGEPNPELTYTHSGLIDGDTLDAALAQMPTLTTTAEFTSLPGDYPIEIDPDLASSLGYTVVRDSGILNVTEGELGTIQSTSILQPGIPLDKWLIPVVPVVLTGQPAPTFAVPDIPSVTNSSNLLSPNDGNRELWGKSK